MMTTTLERLRTLRLGAMADALARAEGSYATLLARWARLDVLILDDWGLAP